MSQKQIYIPNQSTNRLKKAYCPFSISRTPTLLLTANSLSLCLEINTGCIIVLSFILSTQIPVFL
jgi:hypothetical protein